MEVDFEEGGDREDEESEAGRAGESRAAEMSECSRGAGDSDEHFACAELDGVWTPDWIAFCRR